MKLVFALALACSAAAESDRQFHELMSVLKRGLPEQPSQASGDAYVGNSSSGIPGYFFRAITPVLDQRYIGAQTAGNEKALPGWLASPVLAAAACLP